MKTALLPRAVRAINKNNNTSVISLNRFTGEDFALLKDKCKKNILICPWCFEAVSFRVCLNKRNHFAHKSLNNCPFNNESQIILETRALLYQWLVAKFSNKPGWVIDIEVNIGNLSIEKKVDCLVHNNKQSFAYIILDKGLKSDFRSELHNCISNKYISVSYIFPWDNFKVDSHNPSYFFLTPTERYFISKRDYDYSIDFIKPIQGSLYYISAQNNLLKRTFPSLAVHMT